MKEINIVVENTAIKNGVAKSVKEIEKYINKNSNILDYGCGRLRNSFYLLKKGYTNISILDTVNQIEKNKKEYNLNVFKNVYVLGQNINDTFDCILLTYVLNVIPYKEERIKTIKQIYSLLKNNGLLVLEIRKEKDILNNKNIVPFQDGYLIGKNKTKTFQKNFSQEEINFYFKDFIILEQKQTNNSIYIIFQRKD